MIRVLLVDDEPNILEGLKRSLRPLRKEWLVDSAEGGVSALEKLAAVRFDVLVTDMRMPGMDGFALLNAAKEKHPYLLCLALSGQSEMEQKVRSSGLAHCYLAKPCVLDELITIVRRLIALPPSSEAELQIAGAAL